MTQCRRVARLTSAGTGNLQHLALSLQGENSVFKGCHVVFLCVYSKMGKVGLLGCVVHCPFLRRRTMPDSNGAMKSIRKEQVPMDTLVVFKFPTAQGADMTLDGREPATAAVDPDRRWSHPQLAGRGQ